MPAETRYAELIGIFNEQRRGALYHDDFLQQLPDSDPVGFVANALDLATGRPAADRAALADLVTYLPCDLCHKVDIATMAHGLECRQPLLDHRVVEFAVSLPLWMKLRGRRGKRIVRKAFGHLLPEEVFRRPKMGFGVPLDRWLRGDLRELAHDTLLSHRAGQRGYFRRDAVETLLAEHDATRFDHAARLWALLILELWHREWVD